MEDQVYSAAVFGDSRCFSIEKKSVYTDAGHINIALPDQFIEHGTCDSNYMKEYGHGPRKACSTEKYCPEKIRTGRLRCHR